MGDAGGWIEGKLEGYMLDERRPFVVDFSDQIGLYALFSATREIVYVGQSGRSEGDRLLARLKKHTRNNNRERWTHFSWFGFREINNTGVLSLQQRPESRCTGTHVDALDEIEAILLQLLEPRLNKQGPRWRDADEYLQQSDTRVVGDFEDIRARLDEIKESIEALTVEG